MASRKHKKPDLDRREPIRAFGGVFGPPSEDRVTRETSGKEKPGKGAGQPSGPDPISRGVDLGYRVIDQYMRQGQAFAQAGWPLGSNGAPTAPDPQKLTERMYQYASDLASVWFEYAQTMGGKLPGAPAPGGAPRPPSTQAPHVGGFDIGPRAAAGPAPIAPDAREPAAPIAHHAPRVSVDVRSKHRVEVTADLKPGAHHGPLCVHDLRAREHSLPRISGVTLQASEDDRMLMRVRIPDDQPAGIYSGLVVDEESNLPRGTVSVRVYEPGDP